MVRGEVSFVRLEEARDAEPNAPCPQVAVQESDLWLRYAVDNTQEDPTFEVLCFEDLRHFRFTAVNDEGWYKGQCRFSNLAPDWGAFYEILGDASDGQFYATWTRVAPESDAVRHFLFYFRDETFECVARGWSRDQQVPEDLEFKEPDVVFNAVQNMERLGANPMTGRIADAFALKDRGVVLSLTHLKGLPRIGSRVRFGKQEARILETGQNSTDGQVVSFRDCLTGQPVPPWGAVLVDLDPAVLNVRDLQGVEIAQLEMPDV